MRQERRRVCLCEGAAVLLTVPITDENVLVFGV